MLLGVCAVPATAAPEPGTLPLPFSPACISSPFGEREVQGPRAARMHNGIDLPAAAGTWVRALAAGEVVAIRRRGASGLEVTLRHEGGFVARYAHLGSVSPALASGRRAVVAGEPIGRVGRTGVTYGTHLHLELLIGGVLVDPAPYLPVRPCAAERGR